MTIRWIAPSIMLVLALLLGAGIKLNEFREANLEVNEVLCVAGDERIIDDRYCDGLREPIGDETVGDAESFHRVRFIGKLADLKRIKRQNPSAQP